MTRTPGSLRGSDRKVGSISSGNWFVPIMIGAPDMAKLPKLVQLVAIATPLGSYLAGLFEGDGHIWVSKSTEKKHNPRFCITFHQKNMPLAEK